MIGQQADMNAQGQGFIQGSTSQLGLNSGQNPIDPSVNAINDTHNLNYYQEYCRLFIANVVLTTQMKELLTEKNELLAKLQKLQKKSEDLNLQEQEGIENDKKKRFRRVATDIDRHYKCPIENCAKSYGSEGSLNQHIKLKHPDYYLKHQDTLGVVDENATSQQNQSLQESNSEKDDNE